MDPDRGVLRGLFLAACLPALAAAVTSPGLGADLSEPASIAWIFAFFYLPSLFMTGMIGLPIYFSLKRCGWLRWWSMAATGCAGGAIFIVFLGGSHWPETAAEWHHVFTWALVGGCAAVLAWCSWRVAHPQR